MSDIRTGDISFTRNLKIFLSPICSFFVNFNVFISILRNICLPKITQRYSSLLSYRIFILFALKYRSVIHLKLTFTMCKGGFKGGFSHACVQLFLNYFVNKNFTFHSFIDGHLSNSDQRGQDRGIMREKRGEGSQGT